MRRAEKVEAVQDIEGDLGRARVAVLAEYRGLTVKDMDRLRRAVREVDGRCRVTKNRLARRAAGTSRFEKLSPMLRGPLAMLLGFRDPVAVAKVAVRFAEELPSLEIKGAVLDGQLLAADGVKALASLPPREVVVAQLLGLIQAPATRLVRVLNEPAAGVARLVEALRKRAEAAGGGAPS
jgi:large subunit ribosomal protein L10